MSIDLLNVTKNKKSYPQFSRIYCEGSGTSATFSPRVNPLRQCRAVLMLESLAVVSTTNVYFKLSLSTPQPNSWNSVSNSNNYVVHIGDGSTSYNSFPSVTSVGIPITNIGEFSDSPLTVTFAPINVTDTLSITRFAMTLTLCYIDQD
jgi:hypothetical protein